MPNDRKSDVVNRLSVSEAESSLGHRQPPSDLRCARIEEESK